ncbi:TLL1 [Branchiostoma lanceolatum]|uniref:TLL1 protein n=1 Tax=Branchiostoma lanceolatum TaxID=7740 RepID=A0A8S4MN29_BRALA|nr:TLL1 [Branchiostoma lanceolatum]
MQGGRFLFFAVVLVLSRHTEGQPQTNTFNTDLGCGRDDGGYMPIQGLLSGLLESPGHPAMYPSNSACAWKITGDPGQRLVFVFNALDIEEHGACSYDYVQLRDGGETTAPSLIKACGNTVPETKTSTGAEVYISFRSDASVGGEGFSLEWFAECLPSLFSCDNSATCINPSKKCDLAQDCSDWEDENAECYAQGLGAYAALKNAGCQSSVVNIAETGNLSTPNYPDFYIAGMDCGWSLSAAPESDGRYPVILASFVGPFGVSCSAGSIQILTSDNNGVVDSTTMCGNQAGPIAIGAEDGQVMSITFSPSSNPIGQGYAVEWNLCPPDSLACPATAECFPPDSGVLTCPGGVSTTQDMTTAASGVATVMGGSATGRTPHHTRSTMRPTITTTAASSDNSTMYTEGPVNTLCYTCEGTAQQCMTGNGLGGSAMECQEDEACWVERIGEGSNVSYKRSCQPSCSDYWQYEICMTAQGQEKVCKLCCTDDRCNVHVLTGHNDPRALTEGSDSGTEEIVASLGLVSILALAVCADILSSTA